MKKSYHKNAFTLAEVLITLGIIGVVAAITMPTLIQNHQKQTYVTGLKKGISTISNAFQKMVADEGVSNLGETTLFSDGICEVSMEWDDHGVINTNGCEDFYGNMSVFENILPKYLKIVRICNGEAECNIVYKSSWLSCSKDKCILKESNSGNGNITNFIDHANSKEIKGYYTTDGMIFYIRPRGVLAWGTTTNSPRIDVILDINGTKGPNTEGRDLFLFIIDGNGKLHSGCEAFDDGYVKRLMENGWKMDY